jgi:hypothetical protein
VSGIRAGLRAFDVDGVVFDVVGNITYSLGLPISEELTGADRHHGFKEAPGISFMELEIRDGPDVDQAALLQTEGATCAAQLRNGKTIILRNANQAGAGESGTEEGLIPVRFVGESAEEINA